MTSEHPTGSDFPDVGPTRRFSAVMFTDIKDSTAYYSSLGDLAGRRQVQRHDDLLHPIVVEHGGEVVNHTGDGMLAAFDVATDPGATTETGTDTVVALCTDIEDSTSLRDDRSTDVGEILGQYEVLVRDGVEAGGGRVHRVLGDMVWATFGDALTACVAAVAIQRHLIVTTGGPPAPASAPSESGSAWPPTAAGRPTWPPSGRPG